MSFDKLRNDLLAARERRQFSVVHALKETGQTTIHLSLNIPGARKDPAGSAALFAWARRQLAITFPGISSVEEGIDALGPYAVMTLAVEPTTAKQGCIELESGNPAARLLDLDVYDRTGQQIDRRTLDFPGRPCLLCERPAFECMRAKRHSSDEIMEKLDVLLAPFRA